MPEKFLFDPPEAGLDESAAASEAQAEPPSFSEPVELSDEPVVLLADEGPEPAEPRRSHRKGLLIAVGVAAVACAASAVAFGPRIYHVARERGTTVETPAEVGGLMRDTSDNAQSTADYLRTALNSTVGLDKTVADVYAPSSSDASDSVIVAGGTATVWSPSSTINDVIAVMSDDSGAVQHVHDVAAGALGGLARCGDTKLDSTVTQVCAWADYASVGIALFPNRTPDEAAKLFTDLRPAIEHRA